MNKEKGYPIKAEPGLKAWFSRLILSHARYQKHDEAGYIHIVTIAVAIAIVSVAAVVLLKDSTTMFKVNIERDQEGNISEISGTCSNMGNDCSNQANDAANDLLESGTDSNDDSTDPQNVLPSDVIEDLENEKPLDEIDDIQFDGENISVEAPEPLTIIGTALAGSGLVLLKKRRSRR